MRFSSQLRLILGLLAMAGVVVLTSPGVRIATAQDAAATAPAPALEAAAQASSTDPVAVSTCESALSSESRVAGVTSVDVCEDVAQSPPPGRKSPGDTADVIVLNGRGYNYR